MSVLRTIENSEYIFKILIPERVCRLLLQDFNRLSNLKPSTDAAKFESYQKIDLKQDFRFWSFNLKYNYEIKFRQKLIVHVPISETEFISYSFTDHFLSMSNQDFDLFLKYRSGQMDAKEMDDAKERFKKINLID